MGAYAQEGRLIGDIKIGLKDGSLQTNFYITGITTLNNHLRFMLNDNIKIDYVRKGTTNLKYKKSSKGCMDCMTYTITLKESLTPTDTIFIKSKGRLKIYKSGKNEKDYKGKIAVNYGILRASEQSKWYPVIVDDAADIPFTLQKFRYNYLLKASCDECDYIYIGHGSPKSSGSTFKTIEPTKDLMLIAGKYKYVEMENAIFINIEDEKVVEYLDSLFFKINNYFEGLTKIKMPAKFVFAHLPSDNKSWGGFMTYPTIVNVTSKIPSSGMESYLSHEVAHYLFGDTYRPQSRLYWFYLESFASYLSFKYLLNFNPSPLEGYYKKLKAATEFVQLNEVKYYSEITSYHRYYIGPFQLLAIEQQIGEQKMLSFINEVFSALSHNSDGYNTFIKSLKQVGVDDDQIRSIENNIIKKFDLSEYKFIESKILEQIE